MTVRVEMMEVVVMVAMVGVWVEALALVVAQHRTSRCKFWSQLIHTRGCSGTSIPPSDGRILCPLLGSKGTAPGPALEDLIFQRLPLFCLTGGKLTLTRASSN